MSRIPYGRYVFDRLGASKESTLSVILRNEADLWRKISPHLKTRASFITLSFDAETKSGHILANGVRALTSFRYQCLGSACGDCDRCFERAKDLVQKKKHTPVSAFGKPSEIIKFQKAIMLCQQRLGLRGFQSFLKAGV